RSEARRAGAVARRRPARWCAAFPLERSSRLVASPARADGDQCHAVRPCDRLTRGARIETEERAHGDPHLRVLDAVDAGPADADVHLFLPGLGLVVSETLGVRRQVEPVDAERLDAELAADEVHRAAGARAFDVFDVNDRVTHAGRI